MRDTRAYLIPAAVIVGMTLIPLASSFGLLLKLFKKRNSLVYMSCVCLLALTSYALLEFVLIDYFASPYKVVNPARYVGSLLLAGYLINFVTSCLITLLFLLRIKIFFGRNSKFFKSMSCLAVLLILLRIVGDGTMGYVSYEYLNESVKAPQMHPWYNTGVLSIGLVSAVEGTFSAIGSLSFLYYLTDLSTSKSWISLRFHILKDECLRVLVIVIGHILVVSLSIWFYINDNYISHTGFYLPALVYALELDFFLDLANSTAGNILAKARMMSNTMSGSSSSHRESNIELKTIRIDPMRSPVHTAGSSSSTRYDAMYVN